MPRRKKAVIETTPIVTGNYWDDVLIKLGYRLPYLQPIAIPTQQTPTSKEEAKVLNDPLFPKFLEILSSDWGQGPGSISNFMNLPESDRLFYLGAFQIWKDAIKKKNIRI
jgi:hypothetical protein